MQGKTRLLFATAGFLGVCVGLGGPVFAQSQDTNPVVTPAERKAAQKDPVISGSEMNADKQFLMMAIQGNMLEMQTAQLALKQSKSANVQDYARRLLEDHTMANNQALQIATQKGLTPPTTLNAQSKSALNQLTRTKSNFDRAFMNEQLKDHNKSIAMYKKEASTGYNDTIKTYAMTTLPRLQTHLDEIKTFINPTRGSITPQNTRQSPNSRPNGTNNSGTSNNGTANPNSGTGDKTGG